MVVVVKEVEERLKPESGHSPQSRARTALQPHRLSASIPIPMPPITAILVPWGCHNSQKCILCALKDWSDRTFLCFLLLKIVQHIPIATWSTLFCEAACHTKMTKNVKKQWSVYSGRGALKSGERATRA